MLQEEMRKELQAAQERWNFDFVNEVPLDGRWDWQRVGQVQPDVETDEDTPEQEQEMNG
jgi:hypothetical protein